MGGAQDLRNRARHPRCRNQCSCHMQFRPFDLAPVWSRVYRPKHGPSLRPYKSGAFSLCSPSPKQKETASERSPSRRGHQALEGKAPKATGVVRGNNTKCSPHSAKRQRRVQDKTALEIAANEALFGQTGGGADEPWALGLPSTSSSSHSSNTGAPWGVEDAAATPAWYGNSNSSAQATATSGDFFTRSGNHNPRSGKTGGGNSRRAKGGGDSLPLAGADAPSMGNYDHLRMPVPHRITSQTQQVSQVATATGTTLPHRMKSAPVSSGNSSSSGPYFHHFLERNNSSNSSTNSLLFNPGTNFLETQVPMNTPGKRPRPSNSSSNNSGNMSFLSPIGFPSPPSFETDHPLPDFNTNWGFNSRNVTKTSSSTSSAPVLSSSAMTTTSHSNVNATATSSLSAIGSGLSSPNGASMFAGVDSFLPDYDSTLYNLWSAPSGGVMGYETENDAAQGQQQQVPPPLYMPPEDELKMDYPQLSEFKEFNQDLDSYLCGDTMEAGGPSPTTPLGTTTANSMMKMDHLVTADRRATVGGANLTVGDREPQLDRLLTPATTNATTEYTKREHSSMGLEPTSSRAAKRSRGAYEDSFGAAPASTGVMSGSSTSTSGTSFRNAPMTTKVEPKRAMPSLGSYRSGQSFLMPTATATSQAAVPSSGVTTPKTIVTSTAASAISDTFTTKTTKRPRSRQCVFPGCQNRARSHQKCKKHGGAHQCVFEGCTKNSQSRGLCIAHGGGSRCTKEGCVRAAQSKGLCKSHGGGESCAVEGCTKKAHLKHLCRTHGGGVRCKFDKCAKWAQRKGWCMAHAKEFEAT